MPANHDAKPKVGESRMAGTRAHRRSLRNSRINITVPPVQHGFAMLQRNLSPGLNSRHLGISPAARAISLATGMERAVKSLSKLLTVPLIVGVGLALAGCVYTPAYAPAPACGYAY